MDSEPQERITYDSIPEHQKVYEVFKELIEHPSRGRLDTNKPPYYRPGDTFTFSNSEQPFPIAHDHKRHTSFTQKQEKYNDLVRKSISDAITSPDTGLTVQFEKSWVPNSPITNFDKTLAEVFMNRITDTFDRFPNLIPAYYAFLVSTGAGADGIGLAIGEGLNPQRFTSDNPYEKYKHFVGVHGENIGMGQTGEIQSEIQCAAPVLAMNIAKEVEKCVTAAGFEVSQDGLINFLSGQLTSIPFAIRDILTEKMHALGYHPPEK